jgi:hypothetical protein
LFARRARCADRENGRLPELNTNIGNFIGRRRPRDLCNSPRMQIHLLPDDSQTIKERLKLLRAPFATFGIQSKLVWKKIWLG